MIIRLAILTMVAAAAACGAKSQSPPPQAAPAERVAAGATIGPSGYATITDAPPAPFAPLPPRTPQPPTPAQIAGQEQFRRAAEFQSEVRAEVQLLEQKLRVAERGNFVDLYFENDGDPHVVFRFLHDPEATLRKYVRDPRFRAVKADFTDEQLRAAMDFMHETFREDRVIISGGTGGKENRAVVEIAVTEPEFRALVARKGVKIPEAVELRFKAEQPAAAINRPLPPEIAPLVRIFPRHDRPLGAVPDTSSIVKVVLRDGCFWASGTRVDEALVLFPLGAQLFVDREAYLAFGEREVPGYGRVGEEVEFHGVPEEVTAPALVGPIHAACGAGAVVRINGMRSAAAERAQEIVETNARALRDLRQMYGLAEPVAAKLLERCKAHVGGSVCLLSPPPPVMRQEDCPEGTKLSGGLCRTPEGHIRPLPKWLQELVEGGLD